MKYIQKKAFEDEYHTLKSVQRVKKSSSLYRLKPVLEQQDIICVGGRLRNAPISDEAKYPLVVPKIHHVVDLIVTYYHNMCGHSGREHTLALIRQRFWLVKGRSVVSRVIRQCIDCRKHTATPGHQQMADLPVHRVRPDLPPFSYVGIDFVGPYMVIRGRGQANRYGCVFTCLVLRAIHI